MLADTAWSVEALLMVEAVVQERGGQCQVLRYLHRNPVMDFC